MAMNIVFTTTVNTTYFLLLCIILTITKQDGTVDATRENTAATWTSELNTTETILERTNATKIRENLRFLSRKPHLAGTVQDDVLADHILHTWKEQGLDEVRKVTYKSLLSYPNSSAPNKVHLIDANGDITFTSEHQEDVLRPEDYDDELVPMYNAYAANGTVQGELVYANYARPDDFKTLLYLGINITGTIVIAKYGRIYRGNKVTLADKHGAIGVILFSDPSEYAQGGEEENDVYPNSWWLPSSGVQRGSLKLRNGDPVTPNYPSIDDAYRIPTEDATIPRIPCQPISYRDARRLLENLDGPEAPEDWQGPLKTTLHLGPGFRNFSEARKLLFADYSSPNSQVMLKSTYRDGVISAMQLDQWVRVVVNNHLQTVNVTNVIGIVNGTHEPDRYVIAGNHRDSWGFGAVDASSGTAQLLEVTRVLGTLLKQGWKPKRTLVFCSWGGEEFGLIGSTEFVEENLSKIQARAVAYINTDICTTGSAFAPNASPFLHHLIIDISKQIPSPVNNSETLYDLWKEYYDGRRSLGKSDEFTDNAVRVGLLRGGTDHVPFAFFAGVASIDLTFNPNVVDLYHAGYVKEFSSYPAYHTSFDTFHLVDNHIDPGFHIHQSCAHVNGLLLTTLADARIIPYNVTHYGKIVLDSFNKLKQMGLYDKLLNNSINIDRLEIAVNQFAIAAEEWTNRLPTTNSDNPLHLRMLNDQIIQMDKAFLLTDGLPLQKQFRHVVFSLSLHDYYGSSAFPGIQDLMFDIDGTAEPEVTWEKIRKHVSDVIIAVRQATKFLEPIQSIY